MKQPPQTHFNISVETEDLTGDVLSVYFNFRKGHRDYSQEFAGGAAIADYDKHGYILGLELLAPCQVKLMDEVASTETLAVRSRIKNFVRKTGPRELVSSR